MTEQQISEIMQMSLSDLFRFTKKEDDVVLIVSVAIELGIKLGKEQSSRERNQAFRRYSEVSIRN